MSEWLPIESCPCDGSSFVAHFIDLVDEYDENDRLIARAVPLSGMTVASKDAFFGLMEYPYNGKIFQGRRYTHWIALPPPPSPLTPGETR